MKPADIFKAVAPDRWQILGLKLIPFSLGHLVLLHRFDSAFIGGDPDPNPFTDLALAVFICSRTYEQALDDLNDPTLSREMHRWARKCTGKTWWRKGKPIDLALKWSLFEQYLAEGDWTPVYQTDSNRTRTVGLPFVQSVRVKLQSSFGMSDREIFNRPWSLCKADYFTLCDMQGIITIWDDHAQAELKRLRDLAAAVEERLGRGEMEVIWQ